MTKSAQMTAVTRIAGGSGCHQTPERRMSLLITPASPAPVAYSIACPGLARPTLPGSHFLFWSGVTGRQNEALHQVPG